MWGDRLAADPVGEHYAISVGGPIYRIEPRQAEYASILRSACAGLERQA